MSGIEESLALVEKSNWTNKSILYLKNTPITEYDLHSGGLSVITEYGLLKPELIERLKGVEKEKRNVIIGKLQAKSQALSEGMVNGFMKARKEFVTRNSIQPGQILTIKKDALFIINPKGVIEQVTPNLCFRAKNTYTSYLTMNRKEFYFSPMLESLDVKGLSEEVLEKQKGYLLADIRRFMRQAEKIAAPVLFSSLREYQSDYLTRKLRIETYRNLDTGKFSFEGYDTDEADDASIGDIDISYDYLTYVLPMIRQLLLLE